MRRILILAYSDFQTLDVAGPLDVLGLASRKLARGGSGGVSSRAPAYVIDVVAHKAGSVTSSTGLTCLATRSLLDAYGRFDTLLVAGGPGAARACGDEALMRALSRLVPKARRVGAVCTGAFILAALGILDGRRATTHWASARELAVRYPRIEIEEDAIFVKDGSVYTSAGVTAGIDLALALVEEDHGRDLALDVARTLVVFARRPGGQTQFSAQLAADFSNTDEIQRLQRWITENLTADLSVESCARRVGMSPRNFARVFHRDVGVSPAVWVERVRVERASVLLVDTDRSIDEVASRCGFGSTETMRRAFLRRVRVSPRAYRQRFQLRADHEPTHS